MWKHVLLATSFGHAWGLVNDIESAATLAASLPASFPDVANSGAGVTGGTGTAVVLPNIGVSGTLSFSSPNPDDFVADATAKQLVLEHWLADVASVPVANVDVVIPPPVTTTAAPPGPSGGPVVSRLLQEAVTTTTEPDGSAAGDNPVPVADDPPPLQIDTTFTITLPPGKTEISNRLTQTPPADALAAFTGQVTEPAVSSVAITMTPPEAGAIGGTALLAVSDTAAIESVANQEGIRRAIASIAGVFYGDVSDITFASGDGSVIPPAPAPDTNGVRRLTAGSVSAGFRIDVPGRAAQGYQKDCALLRISTPAMEDSADLENTLTDLVGVPVTTATCTAEATRRDSAVWSFTASADSNIQDSCRFSDASHVSSATFEAASTTQFLAGSSACGACPTTNPTAAFPGADSVLSNAAFADGQQPINLQCWPKNSNLELMECGSSVVQDSTLGWPGTCNNLVADSVALTPALCESNCVADPFCTVWMWALLPHGTNHCYSGVGNQCWTEAEGAANPTVVTAKRLQHGLVNVVASWPSSLDQVIQGLQQQFGENVQAEGLAGNSAAQAANCALICHSNIMCTFWQSYYNDGTGSDKGCWTENPGVDATGAGANIGAMVSYPFTTAAYRENDGEEEFITGGEYIQHYCPVPTLPTRPPTTTTTTTTLVVNAAPVITAAPDSGGFMNPVGYVLITIGLLLGIGALVALLCLGPTKPTKKGSRAVTKPKPIKTKPAEQPPPPAPPPFVPLMAQQVLVQPTIAQPLAMSMIPTTTVPAQAVAQPMQAFQSMAVAQPTYAPQLAAPQLVQSVARPY